MFWKFCLAIALLAVSRATDEKVERALLGPQEELKNTSEGFKAAETPDFLRLATDNARKEYIGK
ncbi:unnamed protein product [Strongylus vulgaris]|uniref:Uncharacterized protein n=1 Tax=Strongylus vulgaris TaxID=40348 RepID=A0A3P7JRF0_STRVU|nr:unnamed protein product [Strongylus vulgaris]